MKEIKTSFFILLVLCSGHIHAQNTTKVRKIGKITYRSSKNIYVKFENSKGIKEGDILYIKEDSKLLAAAKVKYISKKSVAGEIFNLKKLKVGQIIIAFILKIKEKKPISITKEKTVNKKNWVEYNPKPKKEKIKGPDDQDISGRLTINSSSNFSNNGYKFDYQRWRYSLNLKVKNIGGSKLSLLSYTTFTYRADEWKSVQNNLSKALRIYDLSLKYNIYDNTNIWFGRHLNRTISNISAVDGIQVEHGFSSFSLGGIIGFRPDFKDMSLNSNLLEYGLYITKQSLFGYGTMSNTMAVFQQNNNSKTDRRFIYFQHSNNIVKGFNFFISSEVDLYNKQSGISSTSPTLTSLYLMASIRASRALSFSVTYDARKDVIYYETFKTFLDSVINNETRQGFRIRATIHPFKKITIGSHFGYRYRKGDVKPNRNYGGFISYANLPILNVNPTFSYNRIISSFIDGNYWGIRISKRIFPSSVYLTMGYKQTDYSFSRSEKLIQKNVSASLSTKILKSLFLSLNYEGIFEGRNSNGHFYVTLSTRF